MRGKVAQGAAITWTFVPPLVLSALVHSVDPDVGGLSGLLDPAHAESVVFVALPLGLVVLSVVWMALHASRLLALVVTLLVAGLLGLALVTLGGPASAWTELLRSATLASMLTLGFLLAAVVPSLWLWERGQSAS